MPASMINAVTGSKLKVIGRSMAMVAVGPMPGSTPMIVPRSTPTKQKTMLIGVKAVSKPRPRCANRSIAVASGAQPRPEQPQRQTQSETEDENAERRQTQTQRDRQRKGHATIGECRDQRHEREGGREPKAANREPEHHGRGQDEDKAPPGN